jgi:hypothetical protein
VDRLCTSTDPPLALPQQQWRPSKLSSARARIIAYGEGRLSAGTVADPIGAPHCRGRVPHRQ